MDKTRDVRRAKASRFTSANKQSTNQCDFKKLRREKVRRLSFVESLCEMPSVQSDGEGEFPPYSTTSKRLKLPRKFHDDCQEVDHASVPRKLRSAIRKRSRASVSPHLPEVGNPNHSANGTEMVNKDGLKKNKSKKLKESDGSLPLTSEVPISKDEEEVVETLYALADMFSVSAKTETNNSTVPEVDKDLQTTSTTTIPQAAQESSNILGSVGGNVGIQFSNRVTDFDLHRCKLFPTDLQSYIPKSDCDKVSIFSKPSSANENASSNSAFPSHPELRLKRPMHNLDMVNEINRKIAVDSVATFRGQHELRITTMENKYNGTSLWPGLSSTSVQGAGTLRSPVKSPAAKLPAWLGISTSSARPCSSGNVPLPRKESKSLVDAKKTLKKCCTHVYISQLIKDLKVAEAKDSLSLQHTQLTGVEGSRQGSEDNKLHLSNNGSSGVVLANDIACSGGEGSSSKLSNALLLHNGLPENQQTSTNSRAYTAQEQNINLFSAFAGSGGQIDGHQQELSTQSHAPYLHPFTHNYTTMPISVSQSHPVSASFVDSTATGAAQKVQIQLPPSVGNSTSVTSSMTGFQKQQQHQWLWAAQLISSYKPDENAAAGSHTPNWQYGQPIHPAALDVLGPRYVPLSTQQQQLISTTSLFPQSRMPRYNHHQLSTSHAVNGGVLRPDGGSSMQLLCNEHL